MKKLLPLLLVAGCVSNPEVEKDCIEYKSTIEPVERCTPFYGSMICYTEDVPRMWCVLYDDTGNVTK